MLIVRSPMRISLAGGGTDLPVYYREYGGAVINAAIDRYFYVFLRTSGSTDLEISSSDFRSFFRHDRDCEFCFEGDLQLPRAILHHFGITYGLNLFIASEIPPGTGLGCSSSVAAGLIKAILVCCGIQCRREEIAELAAFIEIERLGSPIGKQDQYAAALGGLNLIEFKNGHTRITPLKVDNDQKKRLERSLMLFFTGQTRRANDILGRQKEASEQKKGPTLEALHRVKEMVPEVKGCLESGDIAGFGRLLHQNWEEKRRFASGVSNPEIDRYYEAALGAGAYGGKITGAGGGGFLLVCCEEQRRPAVRKALQSHGLTQVGFHFDDQGARVIMNTGLLLTSTIDWNRPESIFNRLD